MFTGIIEQVGRVLETTSSAITIEASRKEDDPFQIGESIAVNGCCLTLARSSELTFALSEETLRKTNLGSSRQGDRVNLERAMKVGARFGGHVVQGHVDTTATFDSIHETAQAHVMRFRISSDAKYVIEKGSIALNGISLTVVDLTADESSIKFDVWIIPHTWEFTNLSDLLPGNKVNVEFDMLAKYVERILQNS